MKAEPNIHSTNRNPIGTQATLPLIIISWVLPERLLQTILKSEAVYNYNLSIIL
jgi:hypothetical protein